MESPPKSPNRTSGTSLMENLLGLLRVRVKRGINLAVRDVRSSDPYAVIKMGKQVFFFTWVEIMVLWVWFDFVSMNIFSLEFVWFFPFWLILSLIRKTFIEFYEKGDVEFLTGIELCKFRLAGYGDSLIFDMEKPEKRVIEVGRKDILCLIWGGYELGSNWKAKKDLCSCPRQRGCLELGFY